MTDEERTELVKRLMTSVTLTFTLPGGAQAADQIETDGDRIKELEAENERLREALEQFLALIKHQYSGSREAMNALQEADNFASATLAKLQEPSHEA